MASQRAVVIGVFDDRSSAEQALEDLNNLGISDDQIYYSGHGRGGGFLESLKNLFTGQGSTNVTDELVDLGLSPDEAQYYANQHDAGRSIVAVRADTRRQAVMDILRSRGAHDYSTRPGFTQAGDRPTTATTGTTGTPRAGYTAGAPAPGTLQV